MTLKYLLSYFYIPKCLRCDRRIDIDGYLCGDCMKSWRSEMINPAGDVIYLAKYEKMRDTVSKTLIIRMKHRNVRKLYRFLADEMLQAISVRLPDYKQYTVTNVPRMRASVKENGLDHSALLAEMIAERGGTEYMCTLNNKSRKIQKLLGYEDRFKNAEKAFVIKGKHRNNLYNRKFLLIDDITTSGATFSACKRILLDNGAESVEFAAICGSN